MTTLLDSTTLDPTERSVELPTPPPAPPPSPWARCAPVRLFVPVLVAALVLGGAGGYVARSAGSDGPAPVAVQGRGDVVAPVESFDEDALEADLFEATVTDDEPVVDETSWSTGDGEATPDVTESMPTEEPLPGDEAADPSVTTDPGSSSHPEPANRAPTFDHLTVSTRSRRALATFSAKDIDGTLARIVVDWGDGSAVQVIDPPTETAEHRYDPMLGNRFRTTVNVTAYDDEGAFVAASRAIEVVALQRVQVSDVRLLPRSDCFDVLVDLRLAGKANLSGAVTTTAAFRETLRHGESAVVLASTLADERPVDEGFFLTTGVLVESSVHAPVAVRKTITEAGKYGLLIRLVHDDDTTKKCTIDAVFSVTTVAV